MVRVIQHGDVMWEPETRHTCKGCRAVLEIDRSDLRAESYQESDQRGDTWTETRYGFTCPECGRFTTIDSVPNAVKPTIPKLGSK